LPAAIATNNKTNRQLPVASSLTAKKLRKYLALCSRNIIFELHNYFQFICSSSQQLMHGLIIDSTAPLYGWADLILKVKPMRLPY